MTSVVAVVMAVVVGVAGADPQAVGLAEGEAAPFTGVLIDNDRASDLVVAEAEGVGCRVQLAAANEVAALWKDAATTTAASEPAPEAPSVFDGPGLLIVGGVGVVVGIGVTVGAFLLAGYTMGLAQGAVLP